MTEPPEKVIRVSKIGKIVTIHYRDQVIGKYREDDTKAQEEVLEKLVDYTIDRMVNRFKEYVPTLEQEINKLLNEHVPRMKKANVFERLLFGIRFKL